MRLLLCLTAAMAVLTACSAQAPDTDAAPPAATATPSPSPVDTTAIACQQMHALPISLKGMTAAEKNSWAGDVQAAAETAVKAANTEIAGLGRETLELIGDGTAVNAAELLVQVTLVQTTCDSIGYKAS